MFTLLLALLSCLPSSATGDSDEDRETEEIPLVGRPADLPFSEASGQFQAATRAAPTVLEAETPLTLTLTVRATGRVRRPPQRIDLKQVPAFTERFYIDEAPKSGPSALATPDARGGATTWEFTYLLKPRRTDVHEVPSVPFVFFNPDIKPASKAFQVIYTDPIPLRVRPREVVAVPLAAPEWAWNCATGPAVLAQQVPWRLPNPLVLAGLGLIPPLAGLLWYGLWRRLHPDAARLTRVRHSQAARLALRLLRGSDRLPPPARGECIATALAGYLRQRLDLTTAEPTPAEAAHHLQMRGCSQRLAEQAHQLFQACDSVRFVPRAVLPEGMDLRSAATEFILAVEAEPCLAPYS
jgi:hypothetical protein